MRKIAITRKAWAELVDTSDELTGPVPPGQVRGRTLVSLTSPGTELAYNYLGGKNVVYPNYPGYAAVFEVTEVGPEVEKIQEGDRVMSMGGHREFQQADAGTIQALPEGLAPEVAVFSRLMGVSMSTLNTAAAHPPSRVLVTGLGPVGNLAAQVFARCGYEVTAVDPVESRRLAAIACGLKDVRAGVFAGTDLTGKIALHVECSGHEQAVLDGCKCIAKRGEVVLVGVPWTRKTDIPAFDLLHAVFHHYVVLRSGWEWEIPPTRQDFNPHSLAANYQAAMTWLDEGSIRVQPLLGIYHPSECQKVYDGLLKQTLPTPAAVFDWRKA